MARAWLELNLVQPLFVLPDSIEESLTLVMQSVTSATCMSNYPNQRQSPALS
jgi:hypothetical protein